VLQLLLYIKQDMGNIPAILLILRFLDDTISTAELL
jgi:hypothetical protein